MNQFHTFPLAINYLFLAAKPSPLVNIAMAMPPHASNFSLKNSPVSNKEKV